MNKREFVLAGGGALVVAGPCLAAVSAAAPAPLRADKATHAGALRHWQQRIGEQFAVFGAAAPTALVLREVRTLERDDGLQQFTLLFARSGATLGAGTQVLRQVDGRALALCLDDCGAPAAAEPLMRAHFCLLD